MKREYDFSKGVRGKFYRKDSELRLPIYLDLKLQKQLQRLAEKNGKNVNDLVNQLVQRLPRLFRCVLPPIIRIPASNSADGKSYFDREMICLMLVR